ncbi:phospholipid/cholesterol/gamma-HCH transport system substrate-binding protein [Modicisalibacter ilicicola DSM 19980]|uniref:Phospholipid/cholesterol/gamma-HCH transport system substrate-binding protein n=1 Tax=Modicisalibacter ilicicola DSM 19980 TaxID=1121942 RepID=A0A1M5AVQ8_9GAMM|nr:MlaD family protein [Halomonas ilicicola]SHF34295.1 phospholipid/cholesterol/gamma-HCH transport system substrate-binding protein [Halomonas ilicicola DSM 19980]
MEPRAHHVLIGLFALITLGGCLLFALWLGKSSVERDYSYYEVRFEQAVSGLAIGNTVQYNGIKVGDVVDLSLDPEDPSQVRALVRIYSDIPIKRDTRASLRLANITGSMSIQLRGGTPQSPTLASDRDDPAVITAQPSPLHSFLADGETLIESLDQLLESANRLLSPKNTQRIERILVDVEQLTTTLAEQRGELAQAATNVNQASQKVNSLLENQGSMAFDDAQRAMAALVRLSTRLESLLANNEASLHQGLGDFGPAMNELNSVLNNVNRITRRFEENPSGYLFKGDTLQEFSP